MSRGRGRGRRSELCLLPAYAVLPATPVEAQAQDYDRQEVHHPVVRAQSRGFLASIKLRGRSADKHGIRPKQRESLSYLTRTRLYSHHSQSSTFVGLWGTLPTSGSHEPPAHGGGKQGVLFRLMRGTSRTVGAAVALSSQGHLVPSNRKSLFAETGRSCAAHRVNRTTAYTIQIRNVLRRPQGPSHQVDTTSERMLCIAFCTPSASNLGNPVLSSDGPSTSTHCTPIL